MNNNEVRKLESFAVAKEIIGSRVIFDYTIIKDEGNTIDRNNHGNFICMDEEIQKHIDAIWEYIQSKKIY